MRLDLTCSLTSGKTYDIEGVVLDYLVDPPQSTTNESELRFHYLFNYNDELNLLFLTQNDIIQHLQSTLPPSIHISDKNTQLNWNNINTIQSDYIKMETEKSMDLLLNTIPLGYKSILKIGSKIRIPRAVLGFTGGRPGITTNTIPLFIQLN